MLYSRHSIKIIHIYLIWSHMLLDLGYILTSVHWCYKKTTIKAFLKPHGAAHLFALQHLGISKCKIISGSNNLIHLQALWWGIYFHWSLLCCHYCKQRFSSIFGEWRDLHNPFVHTVLEPSNATSRCLTHVCSFWSRQAPTSPACLLLPVPDASSLSCFLGLILFASSLDLLLSLLCPLPGSAVPLLHFSTASCNAGITAVILQELHADGTSAGAFCLTLFWLLCFHSKTLI